MDDKAKDTVVSKLEDVSISSNQSIALLVLFEI